MARSMVKIGDQFYMADNTFNSFYPLDEGTEVPTPISRLEIWYNQKVAEQYLRLKNISVGDASWRRLTSVNP